MKLFDAYSALARLEIGKSVSIDRISNFRLNKEIITINSKGKAEKVTKKEFLARFEKDLFV